MQYNMKCLEIQKKQLKNNLLNTLFYTIQKIKGKQSKVIGTKFYIIQQYKEYSFTNN